MVYTYQYGISKKRIGKIGLLSIALLFSFIMLLGVFRPTSAAVNSVTPSTNEINRTNSWAHVDQLSKGVGTTQLKLINTRSFYSCFEIRTDGDTTQKIDSTNFNPGITDGLYYYYCLINNSRTVTFNAKEYVEVRMVFGAETDERFDWTRFDVIPDVQTKDECKNGGWETYGFSNQGLCIQFVNTGKDSRL